MSKSKRASFSEILNEEEEQGAEQPVALSRDSVVTLPDTAPPAAAQHSVVEEDFPREPRKAASARRRSPNDNTRHSYHASLYLPEEAQFALREIALAMRKPKPHDVMLEAMAELFEKYNKGKVAKACRARITPSRDKAVT